MSLLGRGASLSCLIVALLANLLYLDFVQAEPVIMRVFVNESDQGEQFFEMMDNGEILLPAAMLGRMRLQHLPEGERRQLEGEEYVVLSSFGDALGYRLEESDLSLHITAKADLFDTHTVDLAPHALPVRAPDGNSQASAFLNYGVTEQRDDRFNNMSTDLALETGVSIKSVLGFSSFSYTRAPAFNGKFVRLLSNLTWDDNNHLRRFMLGDFSTNSGQLGGASTLAGLSFSRNLSLDPNMVAYPGLNVVGTLDTASDVDIYVNDRLVGSRHLPPGSFDLQNLTTSAGLGEVRLVIRDTFGRESEMTVPYYQVNALLKAGLHNYSYNLGSYRRDLGIRNFSYGGPAFLGYHRYGLTNWLTLGLRGEADRVTVNGGPMMTLAMGTFGQLSATGAYSRRSTGGGMAGSLNYSYIGSPLSLGVSLTSYSKNYVTITTPAQPLTQSRLTAAGSVGVNLPFIGSVSGSFTYADAYNDIPSRRFSLAFSRPFFHGAFLQVRGSATKRSRWSKSLFVGIHYHLGGVASGSIQSDWQEGQSRDSVEITRNTPRGPGFGGRAHLERFKQPGNKASYSGDLFGQLNGPFGVYTTTLRHSSDQNSYGIGAAGSMAWIDNSIYFGRPINDAFALVKLKGMENVTVLNSHSEVGSTDSEGNILVSDLISNYPNRISFDAGNIPVNYEISSMDRYISTPVRGGAVVSFDVRKLQAFVGDIHYVSGGKEEAARYAGLELALEGGPKQFTLGERGSFYLENMPAGIYKARVFDKDHDCHLSITFPESDEIVVEMGEVHCEVQ